MMKTIVNGVNMSLGETLKTHAESGIDSTIRKYFPNYIEAEATIRKVKGDFEVQINAHPQAGVIIPSKETDNNPYAAFDKATEKLAEQLRRRHEKNADKNTPIFKRMIQENITADL